MVGSCPMLVGLFGAGDEASGEVTTSDSLEPPTASRDWERGGGAGFGLPGRERLTVPNHRALKPTDRVDPKKTSHRGGEVPGLRLQQGVSARQRSKRGSSTLCAGNKTEPRRPAAPPHWEKGCLQLDF